MKRTVLPVLLAAVAGFFIRSAVASTPTVDPVMSFTGRITQAGGTPLPDGPQSIQVKVFDDASTGNLVCSSPVGGATVKDGRFTVSLQDCADKIATHNNLWAEVNVSSVPIGRTKVGAVPYAVEAQHADTATLATNATNATNVPVVTAWEDYPATSLCSADNQPVGNVTSAAKWRRVGENIEVQIHMGWGTTLPTCGGGYLYFGTPAGFALDGTRLPGPAPVLGIGHFMGSNGVGKGCSAVAANPHAVALLCDGNLAGLNNVVPVATGGRAALMASFPVVGWTVTTPAVP